MRAAWPDKEHRMIKLTRTIAIAAAFIAGVAPLATAQRSRAGGGGVATTPGTVSQPPRPSAGSPRSGGLPRITSEPSRRATPRGTSSGTYRGNTGYGTRSYGSTTTRDYPRSSSRYRRQPYTRWGVGVGCAYGCFRLGTGFRTGSFYGSLFVGYPFAVPIYVPYIVETTTYVQHDEPRYESYDEPPPELNDRAASKLIVVGGGSGAGDALTVESVGDSVRLSWLAAGRTAREVKLFVTDSAKRELAARTASPSAPAATFEVVTLSAPVAFAGVSVTFTDGVTTTTVIPYQHGAGGQRR
jgi:hypothetical protein